MHTFTFVTSLLKKAYKFCRPKLSNQPNNIGHEHGSLVARLVQHQRGLSNIHDLIRVVNGIGRPVRVVRAVRVVKQWFTSRTSGELHITGETWGVLQVVRLVRVVRVVRVVKQWLTSRTSGELYIISGT